MNIILALENDISINQGVIDVIKTIFYVVLIIGALILATIFIVKLFQGIGYAFAKLFGFIFCPTLFLIGHITFVLFQIEKGGPLKILMVLISTLIFLGYGISSQLQFIKRGTRTRNKLEPLASDHSCYDDYEYTEYKVTYEGDYSSWPLGILYGIIYFFILLFFNFSLIISLILLIGEVIIEIIRINKIFKNPHRKGLSIDFSVIGEYPIKKEYIDLVERKKPD